MNDIDESDEDYISVVNTYMESYVIGLELMEKLRTSQIDVYGIEHLRVCSLKEKTNFTPKNPRFV